MPGDKYFLIINPTAHFGKAKKDAKKIISQLKKNGVDFDFEYTKKPADAISLANQAVGQGYKILVAAGGDGTICEVISGILSAGETILKPKLGILHLGTSPDFNKYHGIPTNRQDALEVLIRGKTKFIDVGKIVYRSLHSGKPTTSYFASNVNIGLGPLIAGKANSRFRKYLGDMLGTLSAVLVSLIQLKRFQLDIMADGNQERFDKLINLTIGKDPFLASGMRVFSQIRPDDGKLYLLAMSRQSLFRFLRYIPKLYCGNFLEYPGAKITYAKKVEIEYCKEYPLIEFDGDVKGCLPATIEVMPKALEVIAT